MSVLSDNHLFYTLDTINCRINAAEHRAWKKFQVVDALINQMGGTMLDNAGNRHVVENWSPVILADKKKIFCVVNNIFSAINIAFTVSTIAALILAIAGASFAGTVGWTAFWLLVGATVWAGLVDNYKDQFGEQKILNIQSQWKAYLYTEALERMPVNHPSDNIQKRLDFFKREKASKSLKHSAEIFAKLHLHFNCHIDPILNTFYSLYMHELNSAQSLQLAMIEEEPGNNQSSRSS